MSQKIKFGTDGWRAIIAEEFTFDNVKMVTKAIAAYIRSNYDISKPVVIGYDTRFMADKFAMTAAEVLKNLGFRVLFSKSYAPTPVIAYAAKQEETAGALMFTASHNPPEYLGIKYIPDYAGPATTDITDTIVKNVEKIQNGGEVISILQTSGKIEEFDPKPAYKEHIKTLIDFDKIRQLKTKILFDPLYGASLGYFDEILKENGCEVELVHNWTDPLFGGGMPEPKPKYLKELIEKVKSDSNTIGFSNDGDSDRFGVIDELGNYVTPNEIIAILLKHLIKNKNRKGSLVKTVAGSLLLNKIAEKYGNMPVYETPVGFKWVGEIMRTDEVIVGGEESGGLSIWGHIPEKDGIIANLSILEAMAYENKSLYKMIEELKQEIGIEYINHRIGLRLSEDTKEKAVDLFRNNPPKQLAEMNVIEVSRKDGVKLYFDDTNSWMLIRPSGTEPLLRIYFETDSQQKLDKLVEDTRNLVDNIK